MALKLDESRPISSSVLDGSSIRSERSPVSVTRSAASVSRVTGAAAAAATPPPRTTAMATPPPVSTNITIVATDNRFDQAALAVPANQSVTLRLDNRGQAAHNWSVTLNGRRVETRIVTGGQSDTITFTASQTGSVEFLCTLHPNEMRGILFVQ